MITALEDADRMIRRRAAEAGVLDFFCKPIEPNEWRARFRNLLALSSRQDRGARTDRGAVPDPAQFFGWNPKRVAAVSGRVAAQLGLSSQECGLIERAAPLNDLGQVRVPDSLLSKQSKLQQDEWKAVRHHTLLGYQLLRDNQSAFLQMAASIALSHHERFDGKGYPHGFTQRDIPLGTDRIRRGWSTHSFPSVPRGLPGRSTRCWATSWQNAENASIRIASMLPALHGRGKGS